MTERTFEDRSGAHTRAASAPAWRFVAGGLLASVLAVAANLAWRAAFPSLTGHIVPDLISPVAVVVSTTLSVWLAAGVYLLLARGMAIATPLYIVGCLITAAASCVAPLTPVMPDGTIPPAGFPTLTIPMHLIAGVMAAAVVPLVALVGTRAVRRDV